MQKLVSIIDGVIVALLGISLVFESVPAGVSAVILAGIFAIVLKEFREQF